MVKKLGIIARMDDSGLGHQTRNLVRLLNPDKVIAIDFRFYNGFRQHPEWYEKYDTKHIFGFIQDNDVNDICSEVDIVLTAETFYNNRFIDIASQRGVTTINQINYEFFEPLANRQLLLPSKIIMPSYWHFDDLRRMTAPGKVEYLPPPTFVDDFDDVRNINMNRTGKRRFLHVAGKIAAHDRAGTQDLLNALRYCKDDFELVIKVQSGDVLQVTDPRVTIDHSSPEDERELYRDFDAMIHPRRYAGLNLPMNEALASGLPVIMTDIEPNNKILPKFWLVGSARTATFYARTRIDIYSANQNLLGLKIQEFCTMNDEFLRNQKHQAYAIAQREFSDGATLEKWGRLFQKIGL